MSDADRALARAVALALTGDAAAAERVGEPLDAAPDAPGLVAGMAAAGFDPERLRSLRQDAQQQERPWPFPVPRELLVAGGFARYGALLAEVRALAGLDGLVATVHRGPKVIGPAEQRLIDQLPPHHGNVG